MLGLAKKAGAGVFGASAVCDRVRSAKKPAAVFLASDASAGTLKRIHDKCAFYGIDCRAAPVTMEELGTAVGMRRGVDGCGAAAAAITDKGLSKLAYERLAELLSNAPPGGGDQYTSPDTYGKATHTEAKDAAATSAETTDTAARSADEVTSISNQGDGGNN